MPIRRHPITHAANDKALARFPLDVELIGRLRASFELVRPRATELGERFYAKLFATAPQLYPLFRGDLRAQAEKLVAALETVIRNLEDPAENSAMLEDLGRRHVVYGAKPEHYELVVVLMTEAMGEMLGAQCDERRLEEWRLALRLVSRQMIAGGQAMASDGASPPIS